MWTVAQIFRFFHENQGFFPQYAQEEVDYFISHYGVKESYPKRDVLAWAGYC